MIQIILVLFALFLLNYISICNDDSERERIRRNITSKNML